LSAIPVDLTPKIDNFKMMVPGRKILQIFFVASALLLFLGLHLKCASQNDDGKKFVLSAMGHYGIIIPHTKKIDQLIQKQIGGFELNFVYRTWGKKSWQQIHYYPEIGLSTTFIYLGNPQELGTLSTIYPFISLPLRKDHHSLKFYVRLGVGFSYVSKPFNVKTNPQNDAIGSYINALADIRFFATYRINNTFRIESGLGLTHTSDAAVKNPNLGLNLATFNLGLGYSFGKNLDLKKDSLSMKVPRKIIPSIIGVVGFRQIQSTGNLYLAYDLMGNFYVPVNKKNKFGAGIEVVYSEADKKNLQLDSVNVSAITDVMKIGVKGGYAFMIGRLSLPLEFGIYVYKNKALTDQYFSRIGFQYLITKHLVANLTLYTHFATADYFEWGVGYQF
jgi:hypothetical protein